MLAADTDHDQKPHGDEREIDDSELADVECELNPDKDDHRLQQVSRADEERVDRLFGLVLGLTARREEERMAATSTAKLLS